MANRSYLFLLNFDRTTRKKEESDKILGLSEYSYTIPVSYKILLSQECKLTDSILWDYEHPISIIGNFQKGREKLILFLSELREKSYYAPQLLDKLISETVDFLNKGTNIGEYTYLEAGEVFEMGNDTIEIQNKQLFDEISNFENLKKNFFNLIESKNNELVQLRNSLSANEKKGFFLSIFNLKKVNIEEVNNKIENIEREKNALLGIDNWSNALYYSF